MQKQNRIEIEKTRKFERNLFYSIYLLWSSLNCVVTKNARVSKSRNGYKLCQCCLIELVIGKKSEKHKDGKQSR